MEYRFNSDEWQGLSQSQRIYRCRLMEEEARKLSTHASPELKQLYLDLAEKWSALASELERTLR